MVVPCLLYSEVQVESLCSTPHCVRKVFDELPETSRREPFWEWPRDTNSHGFWWLPTLTCCTFQQCRSGLSVVQTRWTLEVGKWDKLRPNSSDLAVEPLPEKLWRITLSYKLSSHTPQTAFFRCIIGIFFLLGSRFPSLTSFSGAAETVLGETVKKKEKVFPSLFFSNGKPPVWLPWSIISFVKVTVWTIWTGFPPL